MDPNEPGQNATNMGYGLLSFRGDAKHRTMVRNCAPENLEIPGSRCARPGMTPRKNAERGGDHRHRALKFGADYSGFAR